MFSLKNLIRYTFNSTKQILVSPVRNFFMRIRSMTSDRYLSYKIVKDIGEAVKDAKSPKEKSLSSYVAIGRFYVSKLLVAGVLVGVSLWVSYLQSGFTPLYAHGFLCGNSLSTPKS